MTFDLFVTYVVWLALLVFVCLLIRAVWLWLDRIEVNTKARDAHAELEGEQAKKIRASLCHFEVHGGRIFFIDGNDYDGLPYIEIGPAPAVTASGEPVDPQEVDALETAKHLLKLSIDEYGISGDQIVTYKEGKGDNNAHAIAVKWLARQGVAVSSNGGVYLRGMTLEGLGTFLNLKSAMQKLPAGERAG